MKNFWAKTGWFGLAVTALLASFVFQIGFSLLAMLPGAIRAGIEAGMKGITDYEEIYAYVMNQVMDSAALGVLLYHLFSIPIFGLWYYFGCGRKKPGNPVRIFGKRGLPTILLAGFAFCVLANGIALAFEFAAPVIYADYVELMEQAGIGVNVLTIIASVLLAPIGEELLCRGIIFHYFTKVTEGMKSRTAAFWIANALQALAFGIMHGNWIQGTYAFVLGMGLGWLRHRYQSLYASMLAHFLVNFLSTYVMGYVLYPVPESPLGALILIAAGAVLVFLARMIAGPEEEALM